MAYIDQKEITHFLAQELFYQQFLTYEGLNSGVPTKTTPTVTPTTLRNIEQTFIELQSNNEPHENEAGFVPPLVHPIGNHQYIPVSEATAANTFTFKQNHWGGSVSQSSSDCDTRSTPPLTKPNNQQSSSTTTRRNMGGRKPVKDVSWSPEEEERRRIRRERNKAAAARCRKRRVDHTNALIEETDQLEKKKMSLQKELDELQGLKEHLEFVLEQHKSSGSCRLHTQSPPDIKPFNNNMYDDEVNSDRIKTELIEPFILPSPKKIMLSTSIPICKPNRPNSLNVGATTKSVSDMIGIPISTPSTGMTFNFESLMGGGTGLTPVSTPLVPSCSTQQRNVPVSMADLASPDACGPPKLVSL